eukprot:scaffold111179_cov64-Cyclotella_meneghiniana.AAC.9
MDDIMNDVTRRRWQWVSCKGLHSMSFRLGMECFSHFSQRTSEPWDHTAQTIAAQLSCSLIMDMVNDVTRWRWQWVSCKGLQSMSFGSPEG